MVFPLLWSLAFLSPIVAIFFAVRFYAVHCRRRPEPARHFPLIGYVVTLLVCAIISFPVGFFLGISAACSGPGAGNMCWVWGFFVTGPFAASLAIFLVSGLIGALPADEPTSTPAKKTLSSSSDEAPTPKKTRWYHKLLHGEYSLATSFWGFFILGTIVGTIIRMNPAFLFLPGAAGVVLLGYQITAGVGVWRSANALVARSGGRALVTFADTMKTVAAKTVVVLLIGIQGVVLLRGLAILLSYSHL